MGSLPLPTVLNPIRRVQRIVIELPWGGEPAIHWTWEKRVLNESNQDVVPPTLEEAHHIQGVDITNDSTTQAAVVYLANRAAVFLPPPPGT